jgi:hypothetical protein
MLGRFKDPACCAECADQPQRAPWFITLIGSIGHRDMEVLECWLRASQEPFARARQRDAARSAREELNAEPTFQRRDRPTEGGRGKPDIGGSGAEITEPCESSGRFDLYQASTRDCCDFRHVAMIIMRVIAAQS